jgi:hypothetical protein
MKLELNTKTQTCHPERVVVKCRFMEHTAKDLKLSHGK